MLMVLIDHLYILFWAGGGNVYSNPLSIFKLNNTYLLLLSCKSFSYILHSDPYQIYDLQIFLPILWGVFLLS